MALKCWQGILDNVDLIFDISPNKPKCGEGRQWIMDNIDSIDLCSNEGRR